MIFDMSDALDDLTQKVIRRTVTVTTVDFEPVESAVEVSISAVVQPASLELLNKSLIDYSLEYLRVDTHSVLGKNDKIVYKGNVYNWYQRGNYSDYGFYSSIFEESK